jgi:hypothetical protein
VRRGKSASSAQRRGNSLRRKPNVSKDSAVLLLMPMLRMLLLLL